MRRLVIGGGVVIGVVGLLAWTVVAVAAPATQGGSTLTVTAGLGDQVERMNEFFPARVRVVEGTTVVWRVGSDEEHSVAFLAGATGTLERTIPQPEDASRPLMANPLVWNAVPPHGAYDGSHLINSGALSRDQTFTVTFSQTGTFAYVCTLHPNTMRGSVEVMAAGSPGATTQQQVDEAVAARKALAAEQVAVLREERGRAHRVPAADGSNTWFVRLGTSWRRYAHTDFGPMPLLDLDAFLPDSLTVRQGDTVVWGVDHPVPHTVTFLSADEPRPEIWAAMWPDGTPVRSGGTPASATRAEGAQPRLVAVNRGPAQPSASYDGKRYFSSGVLGGTPASEQGIGWALTFDTPGSFEYACLLHDAHGMRGRITVEPR